MVERNMSSAVMRGAVALPGSIGHITRERIASETGISRVWPRHRIGGPHREGDEP
jgi:hypothetical protein